MCNENLYNGLYDRNTSQLNRNEFYECCDLMVNVLINGNEPHVAITVVNSFNHLSCVNF
jgi:hypothetical protein